MKNLIAITGVGFVTPFGNDEKDMLKLLTEKGSEKNVTANIWELPYDLHDKYRWINECAHLGYNAANLAWNDDFDYSSIVNESFGIYVATVLGGMTKTQQQICQGLMKMGPLGISPSHSIHSGYHFTADIIAIEKQIFGPNVTYTSGPLASGILLMQAFDAIKLKDVDGVIAVGTEYLDDLALEMCRNLGVLKKEKYFSGACSLIVQDAELVSSGENIKGYLKAIEYVGSLNKEDERQGEEFINNVLSKAEISPDEMDLIIFTEEDDALYKGCEKIFRKELLNESICLQREIGSFLGADCMMSVIIGLACLKNNVLPYQGQLKARNIHNVLVLSGNIKTGSLAFVLTDKP